MWMWITYYIIYWIDDDIIVAYVTLVAECEQPYM